VVRAPATCAGARANLVDQVSLDRDPRHAAPARDEDDAAQRRVMNVKAVDRGIGDAAGVRVEPVLARAFAVQRWQGRRVGPVRHRAVGPEMADDDGVAGRTPDATQSELLIPRGSAPEQDAVPGRKRGLLLHGACYRTPW